MSAKLKGTRQGVNNTNFGKKCTESSKLQNRLSQKTRKIVYQYSLKGDLIAEFNSISEAALMLGKKNKSSSISNCCNNKTKTAYNFIWKFKN